MFVVKSLFIASDSNPFGGLLHIQSQSPVFRTKQKCVPPMQMNIIGLTYCKVSTNKV